MKRLSFIIFSFSYIPYMYTNAHRDWVAIPVSFLHGNPAMNRIERDLSEIHLHEIANLPGILIHAVGQISKGPEYFTPHDVSGKAVLVRTDWSQHWNTEAYYSGHPFLTEEATLYLKQNGAALVGIDSHNIDDSSGNRRPVHSILLKAGIFIVAHMTHLDLLPADGFLFSSVPPKVKGMETFPVRAFATVSE